MSDEFEQLHLPIGADSDSPDYESSLEEKLDAFVDQGRGSYADARKAILGGDEATRHTVSLELSRGSEPGSGTPLEDAKPNARERAWGDTTPAEDGFWSNHA